MKTMVSLTPCMLVQHVFGARNRRGTLHIELSRVIGVVRLVLWIVPVSVGYLFRQGLAAFKAMQTDDGLDLVLNSLSWFVIVCAALTLLLL